MMPERESRPPTKYGEMIADHEWSEPEENEPTPDTRVKSIELDIYHDTEPDPDDNYAVERYTVNISFEKDSGDPFVLYAIEHRWKGNYWRDTTDWDWRDLPDGVRQAVANQMSVESPDELDGGARLMDEGGESRWEKHHKPRMEAMSGDEMWGTSFLRDALDDVESAAEAFDDGSDGEEMAEGIIESITETLRRIEDA